MTEDKSKSASSSNAIDEKDVISKHPNLALAQKRFLIHNPAVPKDQKEALWQEIVKEATEFDMAPFYQSMCEEIQIPVDKALLQSMRDKNKAAADKVAEEIKFAETNQGETEVRLAHLRRSEYLCQIGDKDAAVEALKATFEKTVGVGYRIDLVFLLIRVGLFHLDHTLIQDNILKAQDLMSKGGDWERKNRLRAYEGLYQMSIRNFSEATALFLESVPTFGSYELMTYEQLVFYTIICASITLDRPALNTKVIKSNEIQEQLTGGGTDGNLSLIGDFLQNFYDRHYDKFFQTLARVEESRLCQDRYLAPHAFYYSRQMRLRAYRQFLHPYKNVRIDGMASDFGVSREFIDRDLHAYIASGGLHCKIDSIKGIIDMNPPDNKNFMYKNLIKDGDALLNRIQKLARVINS